MGPERKTAVLKHVSALGLLVCIALSTLGCSQPNIDPVTKRHGLSAEHLQRSAAYYRSWERERNARYLKLSQRELNMAAQRLQEAKEGMGRTSPLYYPFYRQHARICRRLTSLEKRAKYYGNHLNGASDNGCR